MSRQSTILITLFFSALLITGCASWSTQVSNSNNKYSITHRYKLDDNYSYKDAVGVSTNWDANVGYQFCIVDLKVIRQIAGSSGDIYYSDFQLILKESTEDKETLWEPVAVDCGFLCAHEILTPYSSKHLKGTFELDGQNDDKSFEIVYLIPVGSFVRGIYFDVSNF